MADDTRDARLRELAFLATLERTPSVTLRSEELHRDSQLRSMAIYLLHEGYVNGLDSMPWPAGQGVSSLASAGGRPNLLANFELRHWNEVGRVLANQDTALQISHKGRVRRSELEQALRTGRDREPFGILWDKRHLEQAVMMVVLSAQSSSPVSVAYLDMNGLKGINDAYGHDAGDAAIKTYLQAINTMKGDKAEGFRGDRADEVIVIMRGTSTDSACEVMRAVLQQLRKERVLVGPTVVREFLTASCGVATTTDATTDASSLVARADAEQMRAKLVSRAEPGASFLAVEGRDPDKV